MCDGIGSKTIFNVKNKDIFWTSYHDVCGQAD